MVVGSMHGAMTYFGSVSASVWYAFSHEVHRVTSPVMPIASALPSTAVCSCGVRSGVPRSAGMTWKSTPAFLKTMPPKVFAPCTAAGTLATIIANFL